MQPAHQIASCGATLDARNIGLGRPVQGGVNVTEAAVVRAGRQAYAGGVAACQQLTQAQHDGGGGVALPAVQPELKVGQPGHASRKHDRVGTGLQSQVQLPAKGFENHTRDLGGVVCVGDPQVDAF